MTSPPGVGLPDALQSSLRPLPWCSIPRLLRFLRAVPGPPELVRRAVGGSDDDAFVGAASRHGLSGLLHHELKNAKVSIAPEAANRLTKQYLVSVAQTLRLQKLLVTALDGLAQDGLTPVLLKGHGLAHRLYPTPHCRSFSDVDLLVCPAQLERAERTLLRLGLEPDPPALALYSRKHRHHLGFHSPLGTIELHFRALTGFGAIIHGDAFMERSWLDTFEGRAVRYLHPVDEMVCLATHASNHLLQRMSWLYDLKLLALSNPDLDWTAVVQQAADLGCQTPIFVALSAAQRAVGLNVPPDVLKELRPKVWQSILAKRCFSDENLELAELKKHKWSSYAVNTLMASDLSRMSKFAFLNTKYAVRRKIALRWPGLTPDHWRW